MPRPTVALVLLLAACASFTREAPEVRAYVLRAERPATAAPADADDDLGASAARELPVLGVRRLRISPRYDTESFVYREGEHVFEADFYHRFFAAPADLLTEETRRWLEASGLFGHVVGPESRVLGDLLLEGRVAALYGDYAAAPPRAVLEIQYFLLREPGSRVVETTTARAEVPIEGSGPEALVEGWSRALEEVLAALEAELAASEAVSAG